MEHRLAELERGASHRAARLDAVVRSIQVDLTQAERDALRGADDLLYGDDGLPR